MDSITHALYRAITSADAAYKANEASRRIANHSDPMFPSYAGLRPLALTPTIHEAYAGAAKTDLYIPLEKSPELLALQMEFIAAGYNPPAGLYENGADAIISPGRIDVHVSSDNGEGTWVAMLVANNHSDGRGPREKRACWQEETT